MVSNKCTTLIKFGVFGDWKWLAGDATTRVSNLRLEVGLELATRGLYIPSGSRWYRLEAFPDCSLAFYSLWEILKLPHIIIINNRQILEVITCSQSKSLCDPKLNSPVNSEAAPCSSRISGSATEECEIVEQSWTED